MVIKKQERRRAVKSGSITGSDIGLYQAQVRLKALKLELLGLKRRGRSVYAITKEVYGFRGSREKVYKQLDALIESMKITVKESGK